MTNLISSRSSRLCGILAAMLKGNGTIQNLSIDLSRNDPELNDFEQLALIDPRLQFTLNLEEESSASEEPSFEEKE